ncbi:MAG: hypothetical protein NW202_14475 [Nitrospira sp.]|nr:hypothetical protein [Nitrospira sp.]
MSIAIKIVISGPETFESIHRFRNCGEDIFRSLRDICSVSIEEIDAATDSFVIRDIAKPDLGLVTQTIKRELKKHNFDDSVSLVRL